MSVDGGKPYLGWPDVAEMFGCGRSKAMLLMHEVGVVSARGRFRVLLTEH